MSKELVFGSQQLAGTERYGSTSNTEVAGIMPAYMMPGTEPAPPSGVEYKTAMPTCIGLNLKEERCMAPKAKGTDFCIGHLNRQAKEAKLAEKD